jgi:RIO-like serine/threonine protein kinase
VATIPFELNIRCLGRQGGTETVLCRRSLRAIANNREVLEGRWNDKDVVIKVFWRRFGASCRMKREWEGLILLCSRGITVPQALFYGKTQDGRWAVAMEKVADAISLMEVYRNCADKDERLKLLSMVPRELARQHEKGIVQKDLHLGNFLLKGDRLVVLDPFDEHFPQ